MSVTFDELLRAARAGLIAVTGETAGYLVLAAADGPAGPVFALVPGIARLSEDGTVALDLTNAASAVPLRAFLAEFLGFCRPAPPPPPLVRVAAGTGPRLVVEIEAALIPVNRAAGRRALARLHRDVARARASGRLDAVPAVPVAVRGPAASVEAESVAAAPPPAAPLPAAVAVEPVVVAPPPAAWVAVEPVVVAPPPAAWVAVEPVVAPPPVPRAPPPSVEHPPLPIEAASDPLPAPTPALGGVNVFSEGVTPIVQIDVAPVMVSTSPRLEAAPPLPSLAFPYEPERTPFLGSWPGVAPVRTTFRDMTSTPVEHDTERAPPVAFDDLDDEAPAFLMERGAEEAHGRPAALDVDERNQLAEVAELSAPDEWVEALTRDEPQATSEIAAIEPAALESAVTIQPAAIESAVTIGPAAIESAVAIEPAAIESSAAIEPAAIESSATIEPAAIESSVVIEAAAIESSVSIEAAAIESAVSIEAAATIEPAATLAAGEPLDERADPERVIAPEPTATPEIRLEAEPAPEAHAASGEPSTAEPEVRAVAGEAAPTETDPPLVRYQPRKSDVAELLAGFGVAEDRSLREISRELKQIADVAATPAPPRVFVPATRKAPDRAVPGRPR